MLDSYFSAQSPLAQHFPGWTARSGQQSLSHAVAQALAQKSFLIAQAGTGTGKTLAYTLPALLSGKKTVVSTHSKHLQDQLADRDLPRLIAALGLPVRVAKLKGRQNYVCLYRLKQNLAQGSFELAQDAKQLKMIDAAVQRGKVKERGDMPEFSENAAVWQHATARSDQCLGAQNCPDSKDCFALKAKRHAQEAEVVVVNHHLLCADISLKTDGFAEVLPDCEAIVVDEAHQLPAAALSFFGQTWSNAAAAEWARQAQHLCVLHTAIGGTLRPVAQTLIKEARALTSMVVGGRDSLARVLADSGEMLAQLEKLFDLQTQLNTLVEGVSEKHPEIGSLFSRGLALAEVLERCIDAAQFAQNSAEGKVLPEHLQGWVFWVERGEYTVKLNATPLEGAAQVGAAAMAGGKPWIFVSATLAFAGHFSGFQAQLGLPDAQVSTLIVDSPFDYAAQGRLLIPRNLPAPNSREHSPAVAELVADLAGALGGRTAVLCTSLAAVQTISQTLTLLFKQRKQTVAVLSQLEHGRAAMLAHFREFPNAVLVGAASLWEGLDLPGDLLNAVVIDKIPFAAPDDPVLSARLAQMERAGQSGFGQIQLPQAALLLKQGIGRLIRSETDWGVVVIGDGRLRSATYGKKLTADFPPFTNIEKVDDALAFIATRQAQ